MLSGSLWETVGFMSQLQGGLFLKCWGRHISPVMVIWGLGYKLMFARNLWYISSPNNCTIWSLDDITRCLFLFFCGRNGIISNWMVNSHKRLKSCFPFFCLNPFSWKTQAELIVPRRYKESVFVVYPTPAQKLFLAGCCADALWNQRVGESGSWSLSADNSL